MPTDEWVFGWKGIGNYLGKSAKTAQRYANKGMPYLRDPGGRPMAMKSHLDDYIVELNQDKYDEKVWRDKGISTALAYEDYKEKQRKEFDEKVILAQKPPRSRY